MINDKNNQVATSARQYELSRIRRETLEDAVRLEQAARKAFIDGMPPFWRDQLREHETRIAQLEQGVADAKKIEATDKALLSDLAYQTALETGVRGRELHPSINIVSTDEVRLPDDPRLLGQVVIWLVENDYREAVTIKIKDLTWWRKEAQYDRLPEGVSLVEVPLIRIDKEWE